MLHLTGNNHDRPARGRRDVALIWRALVRAGAVGVLGLSVFGGIIAGGHVTNPNSPLYNISGRIAGKFGQAAQKITISGLVNQKPAAVLNVIGIKPNDSLIGFDTGRARGLLQNIDWVKRAEIRKVYPNQLEIDITERVPFAVWQRDGEFYVIDKEGLAFASVDPGSVPGLLLVTGEGANKQVRSLVNHLEAIKGLRSRVRAAGRVGKRRWNLYLKGGIKVLLPETGVKQALVRYMALSKRYQLAAKAVASVDLRNSGEVVIALLKARSGQVKLSQKQ